MQPLIHPGLVNDVFGDAALFIAFRFRSIAMLFDLGDLSPLSPRQLHKVTDVFVSHAHMDHFSGFDHLLRASIGQAKTLRLFGPAGFVDKVEHKIRAYEWNLIHDNPNALTIEAWEIEAALLAGALFCSRRSFRREPLERREAGNGRLLERDGVVVSATVLDHGVPCLAFRMDEPIHVNVRAESLRKMGLGVGPWLTDVKSAMMAGAGDDMLVTASWVEEGQARESCMRLGDLVEGGALVTAPGQSVAYVVDAAYTPQNAEKIVTLAKRADTLFIEAMFLEEDVALAERRRHLTARQAGELARRAGVRRLVPFHFSPRYRGAEHRVIAEAMAAFSPSRDGADE